MTTRIDEILVNHRHTVEKLYKEDGIYRSIYNDYLTCLDAQNFWQQSKSDDAATLSIEYAELVTDLEDELIEIILKSGL